MKIGLKLKKVISLIISCLILSQSIVACMDGGGTYVSGGRGNGGGYYPDSGGGGGGGHSTYKESGSFYERYKYLIPSNSTLSFNTDSFSIITGVLTDSNGNPISGATIKLTGRSLNLPSFSYESYGSAMTDSSGRYAIAWDHDHDVSVSAYKIGYTASVKDVSIRIKQINLAPDIILSTLSSPKNLDLHDSDKLAIHTEKAHYFFNNVKNAVITDQNGRRNTVTKFNISITEYNRENLPYLLPENKDLAYGADIIATLETEDINSNIIVQDAQTTFTGSVKLFMKVIPAPDGSIVPMAYYDRAESQWVPDGSAIIVTLLDNNNDGIVDAYYDGASFISTDLLTDKDRFKPGDKLGVADVDHLSTWVAIYHMGPPIDATPALVNPPTYRNHGYSQDFDIHGTNIQLHYEELRSAYFKYKIDIPLTGEQINPRLKSIIVEVEAAGEKICKKEFQSLSTNLVYSDCEWDGRDFLKNRNLGDVNLKVRIGYNYNMVRYLSTFERNNAWYRIHGTEFEKDFDAGDSGVVTIWSTNTINVQQVLGDVGDGFTLSNHHTLFDNKYILMGSGGRLGTDSIDNPYTISQMNVPNIRRVPVVAVNNGKIYVSNRDKIVEMDFYDPDKITVVIGAHPSQDSNGDGGPAINARLNEIMDMKYDRYGNLFISDYGDGRIRKVDTNGVITTFAEVANPFTLFINQDGSVLVSIINDGGKLLLISPDGKSITTELLGKCHINGISQDSHGRYYFACNDENKVVRFEKNGVLTTVAGTGVQNVLPSYDELAIKSPISLPKGIHVDNNDNVYIISSGLSGRNSEGQVSMIEANTGMLRKIVNINPSMAGKSNLAADNSIFGSPSRLFTTPNGDMYFITTKLYPLSWYIVSLKKDIALHTEIKGDEVWAYPEANIAYVFNKDTGVHLRTVNYQYDIDLLKFSYDGDLLTSIEDSLNNKISISHGSEIIITASNGRVTSLNKDSDNRVTSISYNQGEVRLDYSPFGHLERVIGLNGATSTISHDSNGNYVGIDMGNGLKNILDYTISDGLYKITETSGSGLKSITTLKQVGESVTTTITAPTGERLISKINSNSMTSEGYYCLTDNDSTCVKKNYIRQSLDKNNGYTPYISYFEEYQGSLKKVGYTDLIYEKNGNKLSKHIVKQTINEKVYLVESDYNAHTVTEISPMNKKKITFYNENLQVDKVSFSDMLPEEYFYDGKGLLIKEKYGKYETSYDYDSYDNIISETDPSGKVTSYTYDDMDRVTSIEYPDGTVNRYQYDILGNILSYTTSLGGTYNFDYDRLGRLEMESIPLSMSTKYTYNSDGDIDSITLPSGKTIRYMYKNGKLSSLQYPDYTTLIAYHHGDYIDSIQVNGEMVEYEYEGDLVKKVKYSGLLSESITYSYNNDFLISSIEYANGVYPVSYNDDGLVTNIGEYSFSYSPSNLLTSISGGSYSSLRTYDSEGYGELVKDSISIGGKNLFSIDIDKRDSLGRILLKKEHTNLGTVTYEYDYDSMGRLILVLKDGAQSETYRYDSNNNRISTHIYDKGDHIFGYRYDDDGYLIGRTLPGGINEVFSYDISGQIRSYNNGVVRVDYRSNALNQRVEKRLNGSVVERYLWQDLTNLLAVYDSSNNLVWRFEYAGDRVPVSGVSGTGQRYYFAYDQVGSLRSIYDSSGILRKDISYDSFGVILSVKDYDSAGNEITDGGLSIPIGFAGGLYDSDTGLVQFGKRAYDPRDGRFTSLDPLGLDGSDSNLYSYALNDPINLVDPRGESPLAYLLVTLAVVGAIDDIFDVALALYMGNYEEALMSATLALIPYNKIMGSAFKVVKRVVKRTFNITKVKRTLKIRISPEEIADDVINDALVKNPPNKKLGIEGLEQFERPGVYEDAVEDFKALKVKKVDKSKLNKEIMWGELPDGRTATVRPRSTYNKGSVGYDDGAPTLEIRPPKGSKLRFIKIRYIKKK